MKYFLSVCVLFFILSASSVYAHSDGLSFEKTIGDYFIDIGYTQPFEKQPITFVFEIRASRDASDIDFDNVWLRVRNDKKEVLFAAPLHKGSFGQPTAIITVPVSGVYTVDVNVEKGTRSLVKTEFDITVLSSEPFEQTSHMVRYYVLFGVIVGVLVGYVWYKKYV